MPTDEEILAGIRALLGGDPAPGPVEPPLPMWDKIDDAEELLHLCRIFDSLWQEWIPPVARAKYLVKFCHNFIGQLHNKEMMTKLGYPEKSFPKDAVIEFKQALREMAMAKWGLDLTLNTNPNLPTGGGVPPISLPDGG